MRTKKIAKMLMINNDVIMNNDFLNSQGFMARQLIGSLYFFIHFLGKHMTK